MNRLAKCQKNLTSPKDYFQKLDEMNISLNKQTNMTLDDLVKGIWRETVRWEKISRILA